MVMPIGRYIAWVGASLLVLLLAANWFFPRSATEATADENNNRPVIRIASLQQPPERIVIDTSLPTIVPPPSQFVDAIANEPPPLVQPDTPAVPRPTATNVEKKRPKATKRPANDVTARQAPLSPTIPVVSAAPAAPVPPTRVSLANILSGQLVRDLFNLH
jgi:hypothetical protein